MAVKSNEPVFVQQALPLRFFSRLRTPQATRVSSGSTTSPKFREVIDDEGVRKLVPDGVTDVEGFIQASAPDCDVYNLLQKFGKDNPIFMPVEGSTVIDYTGLPKSLAEAQQLLINAQNDFVKLPLEVRQRFDYSVDKFVAGMSDGRTAKILKDFAVKPASPAAEPMKEVKSDES